MGLLFRSDVFDLLGWEDEIDSGRFCFEFKPERLTLKSLLLGFLFHEAQNVIDTKASYGSPWRREFMKIRTHVRLTRKLPVTNKYVKPICIGFGEAEDHDLENLKKQLEDDDLIRGTITAEHQGSEVTKASVHSKSSRHNHSWENQGTAQHGSPLLLEILETNELEFRDINW
ncbi:hypothetical protein HID58_051289 [Brassica napus]|uniref:Uncharacterized protein n=1 Tax=Brassica napus TaxID=3708 RepID=A0ABQ8A8M4_BRANA|nr:hypothetical protein HID58_051289 [Brassica napus]